MTKHKIIIGNSTNMTEVKTKSVHLVVTSPPYPMIKMWDKMFEKVGAKNYSQMHTYLARIWKECNRVLVNGGILCINIGDSTRKVDNNFRIYSNHARIIEECEKIGFTTLPYILWKKPTNKPNSFLGSGFIPPNAYVTLDCEYILIFRKGKLREFNAKDKQRYESKFTKKERDIWFSQIWEIKGVKQSNSKTRRRTAAFPEEVVNRLIRMFSCINEIVLDPFVGTGTTMKVAKRLNRNSIGYEIDRELENIIKEKLE